MQGPDIAQDNRPHGQWKKPVPPPDRGLASITLIPMALVELRSRHNSHWTIFTCNFCDAEICSHKWRWQMHIGRSGKCTQIVVHCLESPFPCKHEITSCAHTLEIGLRALLLPQACDGPQGREHSSVIKEVLGEGRYVQHASRCRCYAKGVSGTTVAVAVHHSWGFWHDLTGSTAAVCQNFRSF